MAIDYGGKSPIHLHTFSLWTFNMIKSRELLFTKLSYIIIISVLITSSPANTKNLYNICTTSTQRLRRWFNIVQMLYKRFVFAGYSRLQPFYLSLKLENLKEKWLLYLVDWHMFSFILYIIVNNFYPFEFVGRGSGTQSHVGKNK